MHFFLAVERQAKFLLSNKFL